MSGSADVAYIERWTSDLRIANPPPSLLVKYTRKEKTFFYDYAGFVVRLIQYPGIFQRIGHILVGENVRLNGPIDIRVMVFPARSFQGQSHRMLHGSYNSTASQISLYPLRIPKEWIRQGGHELFQQSFGDLNDKARRLLYEISTTAIATLLHEIFHAKLGTRGMGRYTEEAIVKKMEMNYMKGWEETLSTAVPRVFSETSNL